MTAGFVQQRKGSSFARVRRCGLLFAALSLAACVGVIGNDESEPSAGPQAHAAQVGRLSFALEIADDLRLIEVLYTLGRAGAEIRSGALSLSPQDRTVGALFVLPPAAGYSLTLAASTLDGATCTGAAQFDIFAGRRTPIDVVMRCPAPTNVGSTDVMGHFNICPALESISAQPLHARVGETIGLAGLGSDTDGAPRALRYAWQASGGELAQSASAQSSLRCTAPGVIAVVVTVSDGDPGCLQASAALSVNCDETVESSAAGTGAAGDGDDAGSSMGSSP